MLVRVTGSALGRAARGLSHVSDVAAGAGRTLRFLRGRLEMQPRESDIYVVTYPRSGTSWTQMILHFLLTEGRMDFEHISQVQPWYERSLALGTNTAADLDARPSPRVFKSHLPRRWLPRVGRFVYVVREVGDVLVSYHHFYRSHLGYRGSFDEFFERFMSGDLQYRSWFSHVEGWRLFQHEPNVCFIEYEAMLADPAAAVRRIAGFLDVDASDALVRHVVERTSFDAMKAHEAKLDPITEHLIDRGFLAGSFLRAGRKGAGDRLSDEQRMRLRSGVRHGARPDLEMRLGAFLH